CIYCMISMMTRPPRRSILFPYTTLFRSDAGASAGDVVRVVGDHQAARVARIAILVQIQAHRLGGAGHRVPADLARVHDAVVERRSEEHTSELQSRENLVCRLLLEKKNTG